MSENLRPQQGLVGPPQPEEVSAAAREMLAPMVQLMMAHGVLLPAMIELLKQVYVTSASSHFSKNGDPPNDSRTAVLTGVHRKDVRRLRSYEYQTAPGLPLMSKASAVVTRWISSKPYIDTKGNARKLFKLPQSGSPNFAELVAEISKDIRSKAVLDELLRLGVVALEASDEGEKVVLLTNAFLPRKGFSETLYYVSENIRDHLSAAVHNLLTDDVKYLEQSLQATRLSAESALALQKIARERWQQLLKDVIPKAQIMEKQFDDSGGLAPTRLRIGMYLYSEQENLPLPPASVRSKK